MGLLDSISRLSVSTDDIYTTANRTIVDVGPFTDAVLGQRVITDIIRDAEESEQTLFTHRAVDSAGVKRGVDIRPVPVQPGPVAAAKIGGVVGGLEREVDVDVLLGAALRIVESYGSMPRAKGHIEQLYERAAQVRSRISLLEDELEQLKTATAALPIEPETPSLKDEERSVVTFEAKLASAKRRRDALRDQLQSKKRARTIHNTGHTISTPTAAARTRTRPGAAAAAVNSKIPNPFFSRTAPDPDATTNISVHLAPTESLVDERPPTWADDSILSNTSHVAEEVGEVQDSLWVNDEDDIGGDEATVVLAIPPAVSPPPPSPKVKDPPIVPPLRTSLVPTPAPALAPVSTPKPPAETKPKADTKTSVKITPELEANTALIWATVGKVLVPSSNYGAENPAPNASETISLLRSIASNPIPQAPSSPSSSSTLQTTTEPQTILTATLLLHLLQHGASPLSSVRAALGEVEGEGAAGLGIKALYACVAKKLLKIDRKGREATVRFE